MERAKHISKGFLSDSKLYQQTMKQWDSLVRNVIKDEDNYRTWLNNKTVNGTLLMDGNPIYSLIRKDNSKALRILQDEPRSKYPYMHVWHEVFDKGEDGDNIPVLVITLELSHKTKMESLHLIEMWFNEDNN